MEQIEVERRIAGSPDAVWNAYTGPLGRAEWGGVMVARLFRGALERLAARRFPAG